MTMPTSTKKTRQTIAYRPGKSVAVLEARDRVGGRAHNHHIGGGEISEAGATFVGPTQGHILRVAKRFAVSKFPTYDTGEEGE